MGRGLLTELSTALVDECRCSRGAPIAPCDPTTLPSEMHTAGCLWAVSPHRLQVENQARLPTAPRGIGNDINGKERPQGCPTRSHPKSRAPANGDSMLPALSAPGLSRPPAQPLRALL